jgi:hypothetical protein
LEEAMASEEEKIYFIRPGVRGYLGHEFERNLTILVSFRCQELYDEGILKDFYVLENVDGVGAFDDVVIYVEYQEKEELKKQLVFIQAKFKENIEKKIFEKNSLFCKKKNKIMINEYYRSSCLVYDILKSEVTDAKPNAKSRCVDHENKIRIYLQKLFKCKPEHCLKFIFLNMMTIFLDRKMINGIKMQ